MALSYLLPQDQLSFEELLTTVDAHTGQTFADAQNFEALFGNVFNSQILHHQLAAAAVAQQDLFAVLAHQSQGVPQEVLDFSNYVAPGAFAQDCVCDPNAFVGSESPNGSDTTVCDANHPNPFAALVIPSDKAAASQHQSMQPFQLFPAVNTKTQPPIYGAPQSPASSPQLQGVHQPAKRQHRAPTVTWQAAPGRAPTSTVSTPGSFSPATISMPSPPLSPTTSVKDEAIACAPSPVAVVSERTSTGGIKTPFDDMADEDLDDLDEDQIMGMMGKLQAKAASAQSDGPTKEKKKRKRRTTAELAPQELEVRRIKNSEAARRCRLRKTLKLRWLEARCTELEETNVKLMARLSELEARMPKP